MSVPARKNADIKQVGASDKKRRADLNAYEAVVQKGLEGVRQTMASCQTHAREMGDALRKIREGKLYKPAYDTWQGYLDKRWYFTRQRAHQLMAAVAVFKNISALVKSNRC